MFNFNFIFMTINVVATAPNKFRGPCSSEDE